MRRWIEDWYWEFRYAWQRAIRGYDDRMIFEFHYEHARLVVNVLTKLQNHKTGHPVGLKSVEEWQNILGIMIDGFEAASNMGCFGNDPEEVKLQKKFDRGMKLFTVYYMNLWD